jgi:F0F1-type ATP synthase assembly protein I
MRQHTETRHTNLPGYGLIIGTAVGTAFGIFVDQIALGAAFGSAIGLLFGAMADLLVYRGT